MTARQRDPAPKHRLVTLGDSLTQGFQSGAIWLTSLSWPAMVPKELGWKDFRYATYEGYGGLPFNIENCVRHLEAEFGSLNFWDSVPATVWLLHFAHQIEHWGGRSRRRPSLGAEACVGDH